MKGTHMKISILAILLVSCAAKPAVVTTPPAAASVANRAAVYIAAIDPDAQCMQFNGETADLQAVLCVSHSVLFYCASNASKRTSCQQLADMNPKAPPQAAPVQAQPQAPTPPPTAPPVAAAAHPPKGKK